MGVSLRPKEGFDILLTELEDKILVETGTEKGEEIVKQLSYKEAEKRDLEEAKRIEKDAVGRLKRKIN